MAKIQCHVGKIKMSGLGGMRMHLQHRERSKTNQDIDLSKSHMNYDLVDSHGFEQRTHQLIENNVTRKVRPDAVGVIDIVGGASKEWMEGRTEQEREQFFSDYLKFLHNNYGERIVYASVHLDESNPHIHVGVVPITEDGCLSAKKMFGPVQLSKLQDDVAEQVGKIWNLERGTPGSGGREYKDLNGYKSECRKAEPDTTLIETYNRAKESAAYRKTVFGSKDKKSVVMPTEEWKTLSRLAKRTARAEADRAIEHSARLAAERLASQHSSRRIRAMEDSEEKEAELREERERNPLNKVPEHLHQRVEEKLEELRREYRNEADTVNRTVCKVFLDKGKDFNSTVKAVKPMLDAIGIPEDRQKEYVKSCLAAVAKQARAKAKAKANPNANAKKYSPPVRGSGWAPRPKETDYDVQEPRPPIAPPPPQEICDSDAGSPEDNDWNLMTEFEKDEEAHKRFVKDLI